MTTEVNNLRVVKSKDLRVLPKDDYEESCAKLGHAQKSMFPPFRCVCQLPELEPFFLPKGY